MCLVFLWRSTSCLTLGLVLPLFRSQFLLLSLLLIARGTCCIIIIIIIVIIIIIIIIIIDIITLLSIYMTGNLHMSKTVGGYYAQSGAGYSPNPLRSKGVS